MRAVAAAALCALCVASPALADSHSVSYSDWTIGGETTTLKFVLPEIEARRLTGVDVPLATTKKLGEYLLAHVAVEGDGENCAPIDQGYDIGLVDPLAVGGGSFGFEIFFKCPNANTRVRVLKDTALFERVPSHVNYARVREGGGEWVPQLFTAGRQEIRVPSSAPPPSAGWLRYVTLGFGHVWHSLDRVAVVLGLLLLARRRKELELLAGGLACGYALALLVTAGRWVAPRTSLLESFVGFIALWIAAELVARETSRGRVAAVLAVGFVALAAVAMFVSGWAAALVLVGCALLAAGLLPMAGVWLERREFWIATAAVVGCLDGFVLPSEVAPASPPRVTPAGDVGQFRRRRAAWRGGARGARGRRAARATPPANRAAARARERPRGHGARRLRRVLARDAPLRLDAAQEPRAASAATPS